MSSSILITGSLGLIGRALVKQLKSKSINILEIDHRYPSNHINFGDIRDKQAFSRLLDNCYGVVHLAAVSRVIWGEQDPVLCWETNVNATSCLLDLIYQTKHKPWLIYASSREVYGQQNYFPVTEDAKLLPCNHYARSKLTAEQQINDYRQRGLQTAILRFSSVYGSLNDHQDRVVPAFCKAALNYQSLRVDGVNNILDFTHVDDTVSGIIAVIEQLNHGIDDLPIMHLTTGQGTSLGYLVSLIERILKRQLQYHEATPRNYDVHQFYGDSSRAKKILNWEAHINIENGLQNLLEQCQQKNNFSHSEK